MSQHVLVLRCCRADMTSHGGFRWPESGPVEAPDWSPIAECGQGLHGWLWGEGDVTAAGNVHELPDARWLVVRVLVADIVDLHGKVKYQRGEVVLCGTASEATDYILAHGGTGRAIIRATATAGYAGTATAGARGTATAGDAGTATAGDAGTATAGYTGTATAGDAGTATAGYAGTATAGYAGTIQLSLWDAAARRRRIITGYIGEDGLEPGVAYVLDDAGEFVRKVPA